MFTPVALQKSSIVTDGLFYHLDASNLISYPKLGELWSGLGDNPYNMSGSIPAITGSGVNFVDINGGAFYLDGNIGSTIQGQSFDCNGWTEITVEVWFKNDGSGNRDRIISKDQVGTANGFILWIDPSGYLVFQTRGTSSWYNATWSGYPNDDSWYHAVGVLRADLYMPLYVNGVLEASVVFGTSIDDSDAEPFTIGTDSDYAATEDEFSGYISQVRLYNRGLTEAEVIHNYNATKAKFGY